MKSFSLAIDTCVGTGSLAVFVDGEKLVSRTGFLERGTETDPLEAIANALYDERLKIEDLEEVFLTRGPGSFTGVRTGLSIARGLREALGIRVRTCTVFEALSVLGAGARFLTAVYAGRREVACVSWRRSPGAVVAAYGDTHDIVENSELHSYSRGLGVREIIAEPRCFGALLDFWRDHGDVALKTSGDEVALLARSIILESPEDRSAELLDPVYTREFVPGGSL